MNEQTKSLIRHALTVIGSVLAFLGFANLTGLINIILSNLDALWNAVMIVTGVATAIIGFFRNKERFATLAKAKEVEK